MTDAAIRVDPPGPVDFADDVPLDELDVDLDLDLDLDELPAPLDVDQVRRFLSGIGSALSFAVGDPDIPRHWQFADDELDELAPTLCAIANRRPELARAIHRSDHLVVAMTMARYLGRNVSAGRAAKKAREANDESTGQARRVGGFGVVDHAGDPAT
jgi:hypothetical protein